MKDQEHHFRVRGFPGLLLGEHALLDGAGAQDVAVDPGPVVAKLDEDHVPALKGGEGDATTLGLAQLAAGLRRLDSVVDRVPQQMGQGVLQDLKDLLVQLDGHAGGDEVDLLAPLPGDVADHAVEAVEERAHGQHARLSDAFLEFPGDQRRPQAVTGKLLRQDVQGSADRARAFSQREKHLL